jgi:hypothetical protein
LNFERFWTVVIDDVCVSVTVSLFALVGKKVDFGECCCINLYFYSAGFDVDDVCSSWRMDVQF